MMSEWNYDYGAFLPVVSEYHPGLPNAVVVVSFTKPDMTSFNVTATTDKNGDFVVSTVPAEAGQWGWVAYYEGKRSVGITYNPVYSEWNPITVEAAPVQPTPEPTIEPTPTPTVEPTVAPSPTVAPTETPAPEADNTLVYALVAVIVIVVIAAVAAYVYVNGKKKKKA